MVSMTVWCADSGTSGRFRNVTLPGGQVHDVTMNVDRYTVEPPLKDTLNKGHLPSKGRDLEYKNVAFL